ncbi:hypothetical protein Tco_1501571 [Tanacetum coccineum]
MPSHEENEFESFSRQCLSEYIRQLILCPHEIQLNHSFFHLFSDEMMSDVDVFRLGVLNVVAAEGYGTLVVHSTEGCDCKRSHNLIIETASIGFGHSNQDIAMYSAL